jgi:replicative DNA helicase
MSEQLLPNNPEAERAILGGIILNNALIHQARALLVPEHFYTPSHRRIFEAMLPLMIKAGEINPILLNDATGEPVISISNLTHDLPHETSIARYANVVRAQALLRQLVKTTEKIQAAALEGTDPPEAILANAEAELLALRIQSEFLQKSTGRSYEEVAESVANLFEKWKKGDVVAIPTQIPELDRRLAFGGLSAQDFIIVAARSSFGKTALALQIGLNVSRTGKSVLIFSLEMSGEKLFIRNLSSVSDVAHSQISPLTFQHDKALARKILKGIPKLRPCPIQVEDEVYDLNRVCAAARNWKRKEGKAAGLIIVDYIQLAKNKLNTRSRQEEVAGISIELKRLAKELNVPVIGVSQFNRDPARHNRRPELSDLRESGQLEQDADVVLFPWSRDGLEDIPVRGMKLYCPKQRNGSVGWEIDVDFDGERQWFFTKEMYLSARGEDK